MPYTRLGLQQFRSYDTFQADLQPGVTIIAGPNGSGKTNILEALYVVSSGTSYRASDKDLVKHGTDWMRIEAAYDDDSRILTYSLEDTKSPKHIIIDGVKRSRLSHEHKNPVVLFEPDHLRLLSGAPSARREYMDSMLAKLQPDFSRTRSQYERALLQRNNMLKRATGRSQALEDQLFAWNIKLSQLATSIVERRLGLVTLWNDRLSDLYSRIADKTSKVTIAYDGSVETSDYQNRMIGSLESSLDTDIARGFTSVGPHRDDFVLHLNGAHSAVSASRGEMRSLLLALKMIELQLLDEYHTRSPLLLLDDVFSELDALRRQSLAKLAQSYQTVITTTDADLVEAYFRNKITLLRTG